MTSRAARSLSVALVGVFSTLVMYTIGLHPWAGWLAWAAFIMAGEDAAALKRTIAGTTLGACLGWVAILAAVSIPLPHDPGDWLWIPRQAVTVAATLFVIGLATRIDLFSRGAIGLLGYAVLFAADATITLTTTIFELFTAPKLSNPLINGVLSMSGGAVFGYSAKRLSDAMTTGSAA